MAMLSTSLLSMVGPAELHSQFSVSATGNAESIGWYTNMPSNLQVARDDLTVAIRVCNYDKLVLVLDEVKVESKIEDKWLTVRKCGFVELDWERGGYIARSSSYVDAVSYRYLTVAFVPKNTEAIRLTILGRNVKKMDEYLHVRV